MKTALPVPAEKNFHPQNFAPKVVKMQVHDACVTHAKAYESPVLQGAIVGLFSSDSITIESGSQPTPRGGTIRADQSRPLILLL
jgi:hypothetical protein